MSTFARHPSRFMITLAALVLACGPASTEDAGPRDADPGVDSGGVDAGPGADSGGVDSGGVDSGPSCTDCGVALTELRVPLGGGWRFDRDGRPWRTCRARHDARRQWRW